MTQITKDQLTKTVLATVAAGAIITSPYAGVYIVRILAKELAKRLGPTELYDPEKIRTSLYSLKRYKFIQYKKLSRKRYKIELTSRGKKQFSLYKFKDLKIREPSRWDKKWRWVIFDVPEKKKVARDVLREKLKQLGFFQVQKSVWVYPFECDDEIDFVCEYYNLQPFVLLLTSSIKNDHHLRKYFNRKFRKYKLETGVL